MDNDNKVHLGEGLLDEAKTDINDRTKVVVKMFIDIIFDYLEGKVKDIPRALEQIRNNPKAEQEISALWSEHLFKEGLVPKGYNGLPDELLISNFHQTGYLDGMYVGYILAMMALADNNVSEDIILTIRDYIRPNLIGHHYNNRNEVISQYKSEKYNWIDKI